MSRFALPIFLTSRNKYLLSILWVVIGATLYLTSNHFPIYPPQMLPLTQLDKSIPFVPWTVWVYNTEFFLFFSAYILSKDMVNANKYLYSFLTLQIISVIIFLFWPTTYPRDQFPLGDGVDHLTRSFFANFRNVDTPGNCIPSMHVGSVYISTFLFIDEQRKKLPFYFLWASLISFSTLTTKQHYFADVVAGFALAALLWVIFNRLVPYRTAPTEALPGEPVVDFVESRDREN